MLIKENLFLTIYICIWNILLTVSCDYNSSFSVEKSQAISSMTLCVLTFVQHYNALETNITCFYNPIAKSYYEIYQYQTRFILYLCRYKNNLLYNKLVERKQILLYLRKSIGLVTMGSCLYYGHNNKIKGNFTQRFYTENSVAEIGYTQSGCILVPLLGINLTTRELGL